MILASLKACILYYEEYLYVFIRGGENQSTSMHKGWGRGKSNPLLLGDGRLLRRRQTDGK